MGQRVDLLLLRANPLQDLACLREPLGVMARGHCLPRAKLQALLNPLAT